MSSDRAAVLERVRERVASERDDAHRLLARDQTVRDWHVDGFCSCGEWELVDARDFPDLRRCHDAHVRAGVERES